MKYLKVLILLLLFVFINCSSNINEVVFSSQDLYKSFYDKNFNDKKLINFINQIEGKEEKNPRDEFWVGTLYYFLGEPEKSLSYYINSIKKSKFLSDDYNQGLAQASIYGIAQLENIASNWDGQIDSFVNDIHANPESLNPQARFLLYQLGINVLLREGEIEQANNLANDTGCITKVKAIGPFGYLPMLDFESHFLPEIDKTWQSWYKLGSSLPRVKQFSPTINGCKIDVQPPYKLRGGTVYLGGYFHISESQKVLLRVESIDSIRVLLDDFEVYRKDMRKVESPRFEYRSFYLTAGWHKIVFRNSSDQNSFYISAALTDMEGNKIIDNQNNSITVPYIPYKIDNITAEDFLIKSETYDSILINSYLISQNNQAESANLLLESSPLKDSFMGKILTAQTILRDFSIPGNIRDDKAISIQTEVFKKVPKFWVGRYNIAQRKAEKNNLNELKNLMLEGEKINPNLIVFPLFMANFYFDRGWLSLTQKELDKAKIIDQYNSQYLYTELSFARALGQISKEKEISLAILENNALSRSHLDYLIKTRSWNEARVETQRLLKNSPNSYSLWATLFDIELNSGNIENAKEPLKKMFELSPTSPESQNDVIDLFLTESKTEKALDKLQYQSLFPYDHLSSIELSRFIKDVNVPLAEWRVNGIKVIEQYKSEDPQYNAPAVLVLDRTVTNIFKDNTSISLVHSITQLNSEESIDDYGEFNIPAGAKILRARTIKYDGTVLEPESYSSPIRFPNLKRGDFIEVEYIDSKPPDMSVPEGYLGDRFYFQSFDLAFHRSELIVIAPSDMELQFDSRGNCPQPEIELVDKIKVITWRVSHRPALIREELQPNYNEFIPSIRVMSKSNWEGYRKVLNEILFERDIINQKIRIKAENILKENGIDIVESSKNKEKVVEIFYNWIRDNININDDSPFDPVSYILAEKTGSGIRLLHAFLNESGIKAYLGAARSLFSDSTDTKIPDSDMFGHIVLKIDDKWYWMGESSKKAQYQYIPSHLRGQPVLMLEGDNLFEKLPQEVQYPDYNEINLNINITGNNKLEIEGSENMNGIPSIEWRRSLDQLVKNQRITWFESNYFGQIFPGSNLDYFQIKGEKNIGEPLIFSYKLNWPLGILTQNNKIIIRSILPKMLSRVLAGLPQRERDLLTNNATSFYLNMSITFPQDYKIFNPVKEDINLSWTDPVSNNKLVDFKQNKFQIDENKVLIKRIYKFNPGRIMKQYYRNFAKVCGSIDNIDQSEIILIKR